MTKAATLFRDEIGNLLAVRQSALSEENARAFREIADKIATLHEQLVEGALDRFRGLFLVPILRKQALQAEHAARAAGELRDISRQFYDIALNAGIEAAHLGPQARGFAIIGEEMRKMSRTSRATAVTLQKLMVDAPRAE